MNNKIDFKTSNYFSTTVIIVAVIFLFVGLALLFVKPAVGLIILFISIIMMTTHYRLEINYTEKNYHDYVWILGFKNGERGKFENLEYLFIKKIKVSQTMSLRVASSTIQKEQYDGYIKFSEKDKIHLATMDSKEVLLEKLRRISGLLNLKIVDYSLRTNDE